VRYWDLVWFQTVIGMLELQAFNAYMYHLKQSSSYRLFSEK